MSNESLYPMIAHYSVAFYRLFEQLGFEKAKEIGDAAGAISGEKELLHQSNTGNTYPLPHCSKPQTPGQVLAAVACFVAWTQIKAGNPLPNSKMLAAAQQGWLLYQMETGQLKPHKTKTRKGSSGSIIMPPRTEILNPQDLM